MITNDNVHAQPDRGREKGNKYGTLSALRKTLLVKTTKTTRQVKQENRLVVNSFCDSLASSKSLLDRNQLRHAVDHLLHKFGLGEPDALLVRDVPLAAHGG